MGIIAAKFRKKKTTEEVLGALDREIKAIETFRRSTEQAHKKIVGRFLLISVVVYLATALLFYFYFFPATFYDQLIYIIPLILAPVVIISTKKFLTWYYNRKITKKQLKLEALLERKKNVLDKVMETETYKVAKSILETYAPEQLRKNNNPVPLDGTPAKPNNSISSVIPSAAGLRRRTLLAPNQPSRASFGSYQTPSRSIPPQPAVTNHPSIVPLGITPVTQNLGPPSMPLPLPRALLPRERSVLDKMVEYLVGDGPSTRYALICRQCCSHNGMALKEEFEYLSFRCCYCYTFNPARKKRPLAPRLEYHTPLPIKGATDSSEPEENSPSDSDSEADKKKVIVGDVTTIFTSNTVHSDNEDDVASLDALKLADSAATPMDVDASLEILDDKVEVVDAVRETEATNESQEFISNIKD